MSKIIDQIKRVEQQREQNKTADFESTLVYTPPTAFSPKPKIDQSDFTKAKASPKATISYKKPPETTPVTKTLKQKGIDAPIQKTIRIQLLSSLILAVLLLLAIGFTINLSQNFKNYAAKTDAIAKKMDEVKKQLSNNNEKISDYASYTKQFNNDLEKLRSKLTESSRKVADIEGTKNAQDTAIENLTKAKNTAFKKLGVLENEIEKLRTPPKNP